MNMNTSKMIPMKGLLKGLRYISHIFENEKDEEIQIGLPTDVKHVAHIGMDGPSANTPSWMNKYTASSEIKPVSPKSESEDKPSTISSTEDPVQRHINLHNKSSSAPLDSTTQHSSSKTRHSRRSSASSVGSEDGDSVGRSKPRRHKHSGDMGSPTSERPRRSKYSGDMGSPTSERGRRSKYSGDMGSPTSERGRRSKYSGDMGSPTSERIRRSQNQNAGSDSPLENPPKIPKSRRKKSKGSSGGGSLRSSRPKVPDSFPESSPYSDPGPGPEFENNEVYSHTVYDEGKECEEISRGIRAL